MKDFFLFLFCLISISAHSQTVGLISNNPGSLDGYILFSPGLSDTTYLIDKCGKRIHTWTSNYHPGLAVYLLDNGTLLRCGNTGNNQFDGGGEGGIIQRLDWNSNVLWSYQISDSNQCQHHDAIKLPNGNIVAIVWEYHTKIDAQNNGRISIGDYMWSDKVVEIKPVGLDSGVIVWQWRAWDHLVQYADPSKPNFGVVADHPELVDINLGTLNNSNFDWLHVNGLDYDSVHDQLMMSMHNLSEVFIIDHSTTLTESAGHSGGNAGHGGDILYRWGNPLNYGRGTPDDQKLFQQHNPTWIPQGLPGAGKILLFNNGINRPGDDYSTVETFMPPPIVNYNYPLVPDSAYLPSTQDWIYTATPPTSLFTLSQGSAQRLSNGSTLICDADHGKFIEIDSVGNNVWTYINPAGANGITSQGNIPFLNSCFRVTLIPSQYAGLAGQSLTPGEPIEINPLNYSCANYPTAVAEINFADGNLSAYPNPFQKSFALHVPTDVQEATLQVHDVTGKLLYEQRNFSATPQTDKLVTLPLYKGLMVVSVIDESGNHVWNIEVIGM